MKPMESLISAHSGRIYVYAADEGVAWQFLQDAEAEGFSFCDGEKPTARHPASIFAVNRDRTINYVGFLGHMAYQAANRIGDQPLVKIDYRDVLNRKP